MSAASFLVSYTTLDHYRAPRPLHIFGLVLRVVWDIERRHASTHCDYPVSAACGTMSSGDFTDSVLQSFFEPWDESQTSMDLPSRVSKAAQNGDVHTVRRWLAAGGSPDASRVHSPGLTA